jgi:hypothetical protein
MLFSNQDSYLDQEFAMSDEDAARLAEAYFFVETAGMPEHLRKSLLENSDIMTPLTEGGLIGKSTVIRLNKLNDMDRRITMAAMNIARDKHDPLFEKLRINRVKERELLGKITKKYLAPATKQAKKAQKIYIKTKGFSNAKVIS